VDQGWIGSEVASVKIGSIEVSGSRASAPVLQAGRPSPFRFSFSRESGRWKLDLTALMSLAAKAVAGIIPQGVSQDDYVLKLLEMVSGKKPGADIWKPLLPVSAPERKRDGGA
jgi:hypothetical protein